MIKNQSFSRSIISLSQHVTLSTWCITWLLSHEVIRIVTPFSEASPGSFLVLDTISSRQVMRTKRNNRGLLVYLIINSPN